ncbi:MAG TPA: LCP family protein [Candidatus Saccharimonadales bacterium]|nr:LCP family protein [Candidatus Saccharimonadales bacterium]
MDNFRKPSRDNQRRSIDSIRGGPAKQRPSERPLGRRPLAMDGLRTSGRRVDGFRRPDGLYPTQPSTVRTHVPVAPKAATAASGASLLHMTLPGGELSAKSSPRGARKAAKAKKQGKLHTIRKWFVRSTLVLAALALLLGGYLGVKALTKVNKVFKGGGTAAALQSDVKPELLKGEGDGRINILLLGRGGGDHAGPDLTDTILVASIDPVNKTASLVSIPRDLWVTVPGAGSSKVNAVFANAKYRSLNNNPKDKAKAEAAGAKAIENVVSDVLGIPIHYYTIVDFQAFKQAVDTVGGVDMNVPTELAVTERMWDETTGKPYYLNVPAGNQHFDGTRALFFTRTRHTSARGDFDRTERQRLFIQALSQKILSAGTFTNPVKVSQLMSDFGDHIATDLSVGNAIRLAQIGKNVKQSDIKSVGLADPPNNYLQTDNLGGVSIVRPSAGLGDYSAIQNYIRNTLRDPYLAKENASLTVLNGTTVPGLATAKANELKSFGYKVTKVGDAPTQAYAHTIIVDKTGGKKPFTKNYLEKRFGVKATTKMPDSTIESQGADFVIILGQDDAN